MLLRIIYETGVKTAAMADQEMEDLDSHLEVSKFFPKYFKRFYKTNQVQSPVIQGFLSYSMK